MTSFSRHTFTVSKEYRDVALSDGLSPSLVTPETDGVLHIPVQEQSLHVLTFAACLKKTSNIRGAIATTLKSCHLDPEKDLTFRHDAHLGIPSIMRWLHNREIISNYLKDGKPVQRENDDDNKQADPEDDKVAA